FRRVRCALAQRAGLRLEPDPAGRVHAARQAWLGHRAERRGLCPASLSAAHVSVTVGSAVAEAVHGRRPAERAEVSHVTWNAVRLNAITYPVEPAEAAALSRAGAELLTIEGQQPEEIIAAAADC